MKLKSKTVTVKCRVGTFFHFLFVYLVGWNSVVNVWMDGWWNDEMHGFTGYTHQKCAVVKRKPNCVFFFLHSYRKYLKQLLFCLVFTLLVGCFYFFYLFFFLLFLFFFQFLFKRLNLLQ